MKPLFVKPVFFLSGKVVLPGDKSIAHRSILVSALARNSTVLKNFPENDDCLATLSVLQRLGVRIRTRLRKNGVRTLCVYGRGLDGLRKPAAALFVRESGTTLRLLLGILAGQHFAATLQAGPALSRRPMRRVTEPLRLMGAFIRSTVRTPRSTEEYPPIRIEGNVLAGISYRIPVASAQVKSALLLAGLYARGEVRLTEPVPTRDHTERMFGLFGVTVRRAGRTLSLQARRQPVSPGEVLIPGDISSAAFFIVAAAIVPRADLTIEGVGLNPCRIGLLRVLRRMGAAISVKGVKNRDGEPVASLRVRNSHLRATLVRAHEVPGLIDELPVLMVAASCARGSTVLRGVGELRVKETDRIRSMQYNLERMGVSVRVQGTGKQEYIRVTGVKQLHGARVKSFGDHRTAMSMAVAGLAASGTTRIDDVSCIDKSFPGFLKVLRSLRD